MTKIQTQICSKDESQKYLDNQIREFTSPEFEIQTAPNIHCKSKQIPIKQQTMQNKIAQIVCNSVINPKNTSNCHEHAAKVF